MITQKFFVSFSFKKRWYKRKTNQSCIFSYEKGKLNNLSPYLMYTAFDKELKNRYGWRPIQLENISYLGEFEI